MDNLCEAMMDIVDHAIKSVFSHGSTQQQEYAEMYYQQPMTSANTAFSYDPIQQQSYKNHHPYILDHQMPLQQA
jgi:hypothetical protein